MYRFSVIIYKLIQTVETLVEFSQGCVANQSAIFDARVMDAINFIIRNHSYKGCKDKLNKVRFRVCIGCDLTRYRWLNSNWRA